jgi:hypothetical protein
MKSIVNKEEEVTVTHIEIKIPVYFGEEDIPNDFPLRSGDVWEAMVNIENGRIENWPDDPRFRQCRLFMKVCDGGVYTLYSYFSDYWKEEAKIEHDYVPHGVVPGECGDYVDLVITDGQIANWPKAPDISSFFKEAR